MTKTTIEERVVSVVADKLKEVYGSGKKRETAKPTEPKPVEKEFEDVVVTENKTHALVCKYSEKFGWDDSVLKGKEDYEIYFYNPSDWDVNGQANIPNDDPDREIDHSVFYPFVRAVQNGLKIMLVGDPGTGKSTMAEVYCARINQPFLRINGRRDMESDSILGRPWMPEPGRMEYLLGEWPKATRDGWFVLVDEPWKIPAGIMMSAQRHMERGGIWQLDDMPGEEIKDKQIVPKNSYRVVLADNVVGTGDNSDKYGATLIQDGSLLNRIDIVIRTPYLEATKEASLIRRKYPFITETKAAQMVKLFSMLRAGYDQGEYSIAASPRNLFAWAEMAYLWKDYEYAFTLVMLNRYAESSEREAVSKNYHTVFGKTL